MHRLCPTRSHHANATNPISSPLPNNQDETIEPTENAPELTLDAIPWSEPSTLGCGELLLVSTSIRGSANVRPVTCKKRSPIIPIHSHALSAGKGGGERIGKMVSSGASRYTTGKRNPAARRVGSTPNRCVIEPYTPNCSVSPRIPMMLMPMPVDEAGRPSPPAKPDLTSEIAHATCCKLSYEQPCSGYEDSAQEKSTHRPRGS